MTTACKFAHNGSMMAKGIDKGYFCFNCEKTFATFEALKRHWDEAKSND